MAFRVLLEFILVFYDGVVICKQGSRRHAGQCKCRCLFCAHRPHIISGRGSQFLEAHFGSQGLNVSR